MGAGGACAAESAGIERLGSGLRLREELDGLGLLDVVQFATSLKSNDECRKSSSFEATRGAQATPPRSGFVQRGDHRLQALGLISKTDVQEENTIHGNHG